MVAAEARPEPPRRVRAALESGEPKGGLVSRSLRSIGLLIPLPWGWAGPGRAGTSPSSESLGSYWLPRPLPQFG